MPFTETVRLGLVVHGIRSGSRFRLQKALNFCVVKEQEGA
jgi:hypothetical protein